MLSPLQRYILKECLVNKGRVRRTIFQRFYTAVSRVKKHLRVKIITGSLERLIKRGYIIGYGMKTKGKWFISEVKITCFGRKAYENWIISRQKKLPF